MKLNMLKSAMWFHQRISDKAQKYSCLTRQEICKAGQFRSFSKLKLAPYVIADACAPAKPILPVTAPTLSFKMALRGVNLAGCYWLSS